MPSLEVSDRITIDNPHSLSSQNVVDLLVSSSSGLSSEESKLRLDLYGLNTIERSHTDGPLKILWRQINNPLIWVLIASSALAMTLGKMTD